MHVRRGSGRCVNLLVFSLGKRWQPLGKAVEFDSASGPTLFQVVAPTAGVPPSQEPKSEAIRTAPGPPEVGPPLRGRRAKTSIAVRRIRLELPPNRLVCDALPKGLRSGPDQAYSEVLKVVVVMLAFHLKGDRGISGRPYRDFFRKFGRCPHSMGRPVPHGGADHHHWSGPRDLEGDFPSDGAPCWFAIRLADDASLSLNRHDRRGDTRGSVADELVPQCQDCDEQSDKCHDDGSNGAGRRVVHDDHDAPGSRPGMAKAPAHRFWCAGASHCRVWPVRRWAAPRPRSARRRRTPTAGSRPARRCGPQRAARPRCAPTGSRPRSRRRRGAGRHPSR